MPGERGGSSSFSSMRGVAALVILGLKVVAGSPIELSLVGQDITGGQLWPSEGESRRGAPTRQLSTLSDQKEVQQARSEEAHAGWAEHSARFWMGSLPHTVRRTAASDGEAAASGHARSGREVFQDVTLTLNLAQALALALALTKVVTLTHARSSKTCGGGRAACPARSRP